MTAEGAANGPGQTIAPVTRFSVLTSAVVGVILIGAGFGIGIGIGAGIWKDSSTTDSEPAPEWFFAQQADSVRVVKRSPDSDEFVVSMDGVGGLASAMTAQPSLRAGYVGQDELVAALNDDPGKNAMLICDQGDSKIALPLSVESGVVTGDNVSYMARLVPFNKGTWDRVDEGRMLNASSVLSSFEAGEVVEFDSSCYMFIDALGDDIVAKGTAMVKRGADACNKISESPNMDWPCGHIKSAAYGIDLVKESEFGKDFQTVYESIPPAAKEATKAGLSAEMSSVLSSVVSSFG